MVRCRIVKLSRCQGKRFYPGELVEIAEWLAREWIRLGIAEAVNSSSSEGLVAA